MTGKSLVRWLRVVDVPGVGRFVRIEFGTRDGESLNVVEYRDIRDLGRGMGGAGRWAPLLPLPPALPARALVSATA